MTINDKADDSKTITIVILIINILLGYGLNTVLGMVNSLQIIIMLPLLQTNMPANAGMVFAELATVAAFDYYDISEFTNVWLDLPPSDPINNSMEMVGFGTKTYIANVGTFTIFLMVYAIGVAFYLLVFPFHRCSTSSRWLSNKISKWLFWNTLIVAVIESVLIISFVSMIMINHSMRFDTYGEEFEAYMAIGSIGAYFLIPIIALV